MTDPSHSFLSWSPLRSTTSPFEEVPFKDYISPHLGGTVTAEIDPGYYSGKSLAPLRPQLYRQVPSASRPSLWHTIKTPLEMALFPLAAIFYLSFCYAAHGTVVPVKTYGLYSVIPQHLATIKGGVTSISIIVISTALYPIYTIISNLKSEEFFRILTSQSHGVPLEAINRISNPSFGNMDMIMAMRKRSCSNYYILGTIASILVWIVGALAPGALTIDNVLADGELMAFAIGAVSPQSVLNGTYIWQPNFNASLNAAIAASITWAEMELGVQYTFGIENSSEPDYAAFIAPIPIDLPTTTSAKWLSDVIGLNPSCSWASTNLTNVKIPYNSTTLPLNVVTAYLPDFNLDVLVTEADMMSSNSPFATVKDPTYYVTNHSTQAPAVDGSTVFLLGQCQSGCLPPEPVDISLDMPGPSTTFTITLTDQTWTMAILTCLPNITIETREVRNNGGVLSVQPLSVGTRFMVQGNLHPIQTTALFSMATMSLTQDAGSLASGKNGQYASLGSQVQGEVLFGKTQFDNLPGIGSPYGTTVVISPAPTENITQGYTRIIQSATKSYLAGYLGTAYVPGRISGPELIFAASIPNLAVATAVFMLLAVFIVVAHFRSNKGAEFTLVNVVAAVHGSELPALFARVQTTGVGGQAAFAAEGESETDGALEKDNLQHPPDDHRDVVEILGERHIYMQRRADGSPELHMG